MFIFQVKTKILRYFVPILVTFIASLSFNPSSSAFCQGVSVDGRRNLIITPSTKHCQAGVGHLWDQVWGERRGEEGAGEEEETPESAAMEVARCGSRPYLAKVILSLS